MGPDSTVLVRDVRNDGGTWWTFAGLVANAQLATELGSVAGRADNFSIRVVDVEEGIKQIRSGLKTGAASMFKPLRTDPPLKFEECLPTLLRHDVAMARTNDLPAVAAIRDLPTTIRA